MINKKEYYIVKSNDLARALVFITGQRYYIFNDNNDNEKRVYSFEVTDRLSKALDILNDARKELYK